MVLRDDDLRHLSAGQIGAEGMLHAWALVRGRERQDQRRAGIVVPYLGCIDLVPVALFPRFKKEIDSCASGTFSLRPLSAPSFTEIATLRMWGEMQTGNDVGSR
jgi:hypothetical protein